MQITDYHAKYYAHELTKRCSSDSLEKLTTSLLDAQVDLNPHQVDAALFAFKSPFSTGAILADEVGLGKTIEAGIVLAQKWAERRRTVLAIVPSSLRNQWSQELADKFFIQSEILESKKFNADIKNGRANPFVRDTVVICSYHFARNKAEFVSQVRWDLVIIDEAHRLRNVYKTGNKIARAIKDALEHAPKLLLYVVGIVFLLAKAGLWDVGLLKDTLVWFCVGAMVMLMRFATAKDTDNLLRKITRDAIKIVIVLEFLVNTYVFPLAVELVVVPALTFIAMINVVAGMNEEHALVAKVTGAIQTVVGFVIFGIVISRAAHDLQNLASLDTARSIALAPLLSVLLFPFIYVALLISQYELVFIRLDFGTDKPPKLRRYARQKIILHAGLSLKRLQHLLRNHMVDLMHVAKESDVDAFLSQARSAFSLHCGENHGAQVAE